MINGDIYDACGVLAPAASTKAHQKSDSLAVSIEAHQIITLTVVRLNGEALLQKQMSENEQVGVLINMVADALGSSESIWQIVANGGKLLAEGDTIERSGLVDGDTLTALVRKRPVPTILRNAGATAELRADGSVIVWGEEDCGGDSSHFQGQLVSDVESIYCTNEAFAALKADGCVVAWGDCDCGGDCVEISELASGVQSISATEGAFAALKIDGSVVAWGRSVVVMYGTVVDAGDCAEVQDQLGKEVRSIYSTSSAFAALKDDGSIVVWGHPGRGGNCSIHGKEQLARDVQSIYSTDAAFAALKTDGSLLAWGSQNAGGDCSKVQAQLCNVHSVYCTGNHFGSAFAALRADGSVVTWGDKNCGGDCHKVQPQLSSNVQSIFTTNEAFAALKADHGVVAWGDEYFGGDCSAALEQLNCGVDFIYSTGEAFAALKIDGSVVAWGSRTEGAAALASKQQPGTAQP
eukprot:gnl/MRDRNA2_/MRDRNA2_80227_c0_seq1.p1 gnl/MRDRNA2_/MRDRNA2_80227_c0~~gnl/MRDRNA2_/MRDRNA2_80227_c0_seq1.p1  ORF type:complete len:464 (+),score=115.07 gnl/MRDRNA2_/MRDRNA2_80227_c0_seq1:155-1546(+)